VTATVCAALFAGFVFGLLTAVFYVLRAPDGRPKITLDAVTMKLPPMRGRNETLRNIPVAERLAEKERSLGRS
jgi:hypothetical protein